MDIGKLLGGLALLALGAVLYWRARQRLRLRRYGAAGELRAVGSLGARIAWVLLFVASSLLVFFGGAVTLAGIING